MNAKTLSIARWENTARWYEAEFICDLLGCLVVIRRWGSNHSRQHGMKTEMVQNEAAGYAFIEKLNIRRISRKSPYWRAC
jgi:hypothetical protein